MAMPHALCRASAGCLAALLWAAAAGAQEDLPVLETTRPVVTIRLGDRTYRDGWQLAPEVNPDTYEVDVPEGGSERVAFISDVDSIAFTVRLGDRHDFVIQHGADRCMTRVSGVRFVPMAVFDSTYRAEHRHAISVEVPEAYELVNVVIALTPAGLADRNLVYHNSEYYAEMLKWFEPFRNHRAIAAIESTLKRQPYVYGNLKMNGYSFEFDPNGKLVQSAIYDRTAFPSERRNSLRPFIPALQSFADTSNFRAFYRAHRKLYESEIASFRDEIDLEAMRGWLDRNFPGSAGYDSYKIIFSPLVAYSQSSTWIETPGFRELQAHVNFPYPEDAARMLGDVRHSKTAETVLRGAIVFTELNHGYINPEADKYRERVVRATSERDVWVEPARDPNYYAGISTFNEYMNWALVSLWAVDRMPRAEQDALIAIVDEMTARRGFSRFREFDAFLVERYRHRNAGVTVADLYPEIIEWFETLNARKAR